MRKYAEAHWVAAGERGGYTGAGASNLQPEACGRAQSGGHERSRCGGGGAPGGGAGGARARRGGLRSAEERVAKWGDWGREAAGTRRRWRGKRWILESGRLREMRHME